MPRPRLVIGDWNAICDRCGLRHKASELSSEWTGLKVCSSCFEYRHPQDFLRIPRTEQPPEWTRPEQTDGDVSPTYISSTVGVQS